MREKRNFINNSCKIISNATKVKPDWFALCQDKLRYQISSQYHKRQERKVGKTKFLLRAITQVKRSNVTKVELENIIFAQGNNWSKSRSKVTKFELDLYHVKANSYTKWSQYRKKTTEKSSENLSGRTQSGLTNRQTDGQTDRCEETYSPPNFTGRGLIKSAHCVNPVVWLSIKIHM